MNKPRTVEVEVKITHTDHNGQVREVRHVMVYPTKGDNPIFIVTDVDNAYRGFQEKYSDMLVNYFKFHSRRV
jgi:hypothetical protein